MKLYISLPITGKERTIKYRLNRMMAYAKSHWPEAEIVLPVDIEYFDENGVHQCESRGDWETYMTMDFENLIRCDMCLFDNYWWNSKGCRIERAVCKEAGIDIFTMTL